MAACSTCLTVVDKLYVICRKAAAMCLHCRTYSLMWWTVTLLTVRVAFLSSWLWSHVMLGLMWTILHQSLRSTSRAAHWLHGTVPAHRPTAARCMSRTNASSCSSTCSLAHVLALDSSSETAPRYFCSFSSAAVIGSVAYCILYGILWVAAWHSGDFVWLTNVKLS